MADRDSWCTPQYIVDAALEFFGGPPDLDPCSNEHSLMPAKRKIMLPEDGLAVDWSKANTIWLNPPYSNVDPWLKKLHRWETCGRRKNMAALAIVRLDPSTEWWGSYINGRAMLFFNNRVRFVPPPNVKATSPSQNVTVVAFGNDFYAHEPLAHAFRGRGTVMVAA